MWCMACAKFPTKSIYADFDNRKIALLRKTNVLAVLLVRELASLLQLRAM